MNKQTCQRCSERATLHITEVFEDGMFEEVYLCQKCAGGYLQDAEQPSLSGKSALEKISSEPATTTPPCPICRTSFADFRSSGRLGCPHDYVVFHKELSQLIENIHGHARHIGKVPRQLPRDARVQARLVQLRQELQQAIAVEDYEKAAQLRDQIDGLQKET